MQKLIVRHGSVDDCSQRRRGRFGPQRPNGSPPPHGPSRRFAPKSLTDFWTRARCVVVMPDLKKAAFIVGGEYGKGVMSCRAGDQWSAPVFMQLAKGSWGFQAGVEQADVVLLVMNEKGVQKLLQNKVTLGADASVAAGPVGRRARRRHRRGADGRDSRVLALEGAVCRHRHLRRRAPAGRRCQRRRLRRRRDGADDSGEPRNLGAARSGAIPARAQHDVAAPANTAAPLPAPAGPPRPLRGPRRCRRPTTICARASSTSSRPWIASSRTRRRRRSARAARPTRWRASTVRVDRARLLQLRQQLDALLATLNRR